MVRRAAMESVLTAGSASKRRLARQVDLHHLRRLLVQHAETGGKTVKVQRRAPRRASSGISRRRTAAIDSLTQHGGSAGDLAVGGIIAVGILLQMRLHLPYQLRMPIAGPGMRQVRPTRCWLAASLAERTSPQAAGGPSSDGNQLRLVAQVRAHHLDQFHVVLRKLAPACRAPGGRCRRRLQRTATLIGASQASRVRRPRCRGCSW